jgi:hypothetical protein
VLRGPAALIGSVLLTLVANVAAVAGPIVSATQHKDLGFRAHYPFHVHKEDSASLCPFVPPGLPAGLGYSIDATGTFNCNVDLGTDMNFSYDKADVTAGNTLPLHVSYTPTGGSTVAVSIPVTVNVQGCIKDCILPDVCEGLTIPCEFDAGPTSFTPPLTGDAPVHVPITSCTLTFSILGFLDIGSAHVEGEVVMSPVPAGGLALGGAVGAYGVSGPASTSGIPLLEWDNSGQTKDAGIALNNPLPASSDVQVNFKPVLHWLATSANLRLVINLASGFHDVGIGDPSPIDLFSGSLGQVFTQVGLDTEVHNAVVAAVGFDPGFGAAIAAGNVPIPLLDPQLQSLTTGDTPVMGGASFTFNTDVTPATTVAFLTPSPTVFGWNNTSVDVTLSALDTPGGSGVHEIDYSASGAQPIGGTNSLSNPTVIHVTTPGITTITFHSVDNQSNVESDQTVTVRIDEIAPAIVVNQPTNGDYTHSSTLTLDYNVSDAGGSGLNTSTTLLDGAATLNGHGLASGQAIPLLTELALGSHTFQVSADDKAANSSSMSVTFNIVVTAQSIKDDVTQLLSGGDIKKAQLKNSLLAKLNAAANAIARGNCTAAANIYQAFINEVTAQTGKGIDAIAANIMIADAQYMIDHCSSFLAGIDPNHLPNGGGGPNNPNGGGVNAPDGSDGGNSLDVQSGLAVDESGAGPSTIDFGGRPVVAWPSPYRDGNLSIAYAAGGRSLDGEDILIYDLAGRTVRSLVSAPYSSGYRVANWDGRDARGERVPGGMYFIRAGGPQGQLLRLAVVR